MTKTYIDEKTEYDNCLDVKEVGKGNLSDFLDEDDAPEVDDKLWKKHWTGMPEFEQEKNPPYKKLIVSFRTKEDYDEFAKLIDQKLTMKTKSIWHPRLDREANSLLRWIEE